MFSAGRVGVAGARAAIASLAACPSRPAPAVTAALGVGSQRWGAAYCPPSRGVLKGEEGRVAAPAGSRGAASKAGKDDFFPNSWVEPDALWSYVDSSDEDYEKEALELGDRNKEWRKRMEKSDPEFFRRLGSGQAPKYLWIGCADSRVAPENLVDAKPGEIFVHRNIANMVVATDTNLRAILQYAVGVLEVEHIVVCGHYDCGGVKAAVKQMDHTPPLESWLSNIRDVHRLHQEELEAIVDPEERHKRMVELNVQEQCINLFKTGDVQSRRCYTAQRPHKYAYALPRIHGMVFSPSDGILRRLPIDFKEIMRKHRDVYGLYDHQMFLASNVDPRV